ncbi:hypothetical protein WN51_10273 [Melipona quadrifasciata]|uniref:Uncharacterized protein n=2 Tax=Meliponini TaxID=83319 RepID=A0A0M9A6X8_9HYME|nr:hypothetical protein WN51_10273 [Melipona quadrifasciata]
MGNSWQRMEVVAEREQSVIGEGEARTNGDKSPLSRRTASKEEPISSGEYLIQSSLPTIKETVMLIASTSNILLDNNSEKAIRCVESKVKKTQLSLQSKETNVVNFMRLLVMRLVFGVASAMGLGENLSGVLGGIFVPPGAEDYSDYADDDFISDLF